MESKVSGLLADTIAPELQRAFNGATLFRTFSTVVPYIGTINKAHLVMLREQNIIAEDVAKALAGVVIDLENEGADAFELDATREEAYFNYEHEVINRLGSDIGGRLHVARSRNDLRSTQDRLQTRDKLSAIMGHLLMLRRELLDAADKYKHVVMPGYTHQQPAQPITFGWYLLAVAIGLARDYERLADAFRRTNYSPLGAGAMSGTSFPIDRERTAKLLGFEGAVPHALDAVACRDTLLETVSSCTLLMISVGRMAQDFYTMTTHEVQTLHLSDRVASTSSIMPQKKNMSALENTKARPAYLAGALMTALASYKGVPYTHTQDGNMDCQRWAWDALTEVENALPAISVIVQSITPKTERMLELAQKNFSTATELADLMVKESNLSFRDAHHIVGRVVRLALNQGLASNEVTAEIVDQAAVETIGRPVGLSDVQVKTAMDATKAVESRNGSGGPSQADTAVLMAQAEETHAADVAAYQEQSRKLAAAEATLNEATLRLAGRA